MKRMGWMICGIVGLLLQGTRASELVPPDRTVVFKECAGGDLKLYLYEPEGKLEKRPCVVFFFGGGWVSGRPSQFFQQAHYFKQRGVVAISAQYRTKNSHKVAPDKCVEDGKSAIRWVRRHAVQLRVDPRKIIAAGGSAGGHVAACTGVIQGFEGKGDDMAIRSKPDAMVLFNPVLDTTQKGYGAAKMGKNMTRLSPCHQVTKGIPPTLILHGSADKTVPLENVQRFAKLMKEAGNPCELIAYKGRGHGFFNGSWFRKGNDDADFQKTVQAMDEFLVKLGMIPAAQ